LTEAPLLQGAKGGKGKVVPSTEQTSPFSRLEILLVDDTPMNLMVRHACVTPKENTSVENQ
jgi:hypothetical protein